MRSPELPTFRYHPDPVATEVFQQSGTVCRCCRRARGWIYTGPLYSQESLRDALCPWCIADGSAASTLGATFCDPHPLSTAGVPQVVIDEVTHRTPGYVSWQQDQWASHCDDACAFLGDLPSGEVGSIEPAQQEELSRAHHLSVEDWQAIADQYEPAGQPAIYVFRCVHCASRIYRMDYT